MDVASTAVNALLIAGVGLAVAWFGKGQVDALRESMRQRFDAVDQQFDGLDQRIDRLEERLDRRIDGLESRINAMRSDLTQLALAVGVRPRATNA